MSADIERLWITARNQYGQRCDRRRPSAGITAVLVALLRHDKPAHGAELARLSGQHQPNLAGHWLPKLDRYRFITVAYTQEGTGGQGGGRPSAFWRLTANGRELAELLVSQKCHGSTA